MIFCWFSRHHWRPLCCASCRKQSPRIYIRLSAEERRKWSFIDGQRICVECLLAVEMGYASLPLPTDNNEPYFPSCFLPTRSLRTRNQGLRMKPDSRLRKVDSGTAWCETLSFTAPYKESPYVTEKLARCSCKALIGHQMSESSTSSKKTLKNSSATVVV